MLSAYQQVVHAAMQWQSTSMLLKWFIISDSLKIFLHDESSRKQCMRQLFADPMAWHYRAVRSVSQDSMSLEIRY